MRGDPLRLCATGHPAILYHEATCPYCALQQQLTTALAQLRHLEHQIAREQKKQQQQTKLKKEE